jgi:uncharacterized membrane protein
VPEPDIGQFLQKELCPIEVTAYPLYGPAFPEILALDKRDNKHAPLPPAFFKEPDAAMIRIYAKRLERDLKSWHEKGWVTAEGYKAILAEQAQGAKITASAALTVVGAILLGFAAISFVAANWNEIPRLLRLGILIGALWAAYGSAAWLYRRELPDFAQAAVLSGALFFGAAVVLVTQMYHIGSGDLPGFMLLWTAGAALSALLFRSSLTLAAAMILAVAWDYTWMDAAPHRVHWQFLPVWAALTAAIAWNRSGAGLHVAAIALVAWLFMIGSNVYPHPHTLVAAIGAAGVAISAGIVAVAESDLARRIATRAVPYAIIACFGGLLPQHAHTIWPAIETGIFVIETGIAIAAGIAIAYFMLTKPGSRLQQIEPLLFAYAGGVAFYGLCILQFYQHATLTSIVAAAILAFAVLAGALICGIQVRSRLVMWLAYAGLVTEMLWLYFDKLGNLINTSLFFLVMGAAVFALAWVLMRYGGAPRETEVRS